MTVVRGTSSYMAPECAQGGNHTVAFFQRTDLFAFGATLHELHFGCTPSMQWVFTPGAALPRKDLVGAHLRALIKGLLRAKSNERMRSLFYTYRVPPCPHRHFSYVTA